MWRFLFHLCVDLDAKTLRMMEKTIDATQRITAKIPKNVGYAETVVPASSDITFFIDFAVFPIAIIMKNAKNPYQRSPIIVEIKARLQKRILYLFFLNSAEVSIGIRMLWD